MKVILFPRHRVLFSNLMHRHTVRKSSVCCLASDSACLSRVNERHYFKQANSDEAGHFGAVTANPFILEFFKMVTTVKTVHLRTLDFWRAFQ